MFNSKYGINEKIDCSDEGIMYAAIRLNCEQSDLMKAIMSVGDDYKVVELYLELNRLIKEE